MIKMIVLLGTTIQPFAKFMFNNPFYIPVVLILLYSGFAILKSCEWRKCGHFLEDLGEAILNPFANKSTVYTSGIITWLLMCIAIIFWGIKYSSKIDLSLLDALFAFPALGLVVYLIWNWKLSKEDNKNEIQVGDQLTPYEKEVELIKFVERHANYMIFGVTGVFMAAQYFYNLGQAVSRPNLSVFYIFTFMSLLFSVWGVLPLIWSPKENMKHLEWLRHYKTVWYGYSIFLLCAGILAFAKAMLRFSGIL